MKVLLKITCKANLLLKFSFQLDFLHLSHAQMVEETWKAKIIDPPTRGMRRLAYQIIWRLFLWNEKIPFHCVAIKYFLRKCPTNVHKQCTESVIFLSYRKQIAVNKIFIRSKVEGRLSSLMKPFRGSNRSWDGSDFVTLQKWKPPFPQRRGVPRLTLETIGHVA